MNKKTSTSRTLLQKPPSRRLRAFAYDPSLALEMDRALINEVTINVPWEKSVGDIDILEPGPVGEYLEVVDYDPHSKCFYDPVDLDDPYLLAQDGHAPSESNPQFHQQMVYAVAMKTIGHFEEALGRRALWSDYIPRDNMGNVVEQRDERGRRIDAARFVRRLRVYPHAFREANAFYSPNKKAILCGYFPVSAGETRSLVAPGTLVFTCLSHDIIAHETTHALLDGLHVRFTEPTNPDILALHEAFADIVALFQHLTYSELLRHEIAKTRGDLRQENLLSKLAQQLGLALGRRSALRDALGQREDETWKPRQPDPSLLMRASEPHERGSILVAAVFHSFLSIYTSRVSDLLRIATGGTGELPEGEIHPDLVQRMATEASKAAKHVLHMCIRALDYCPPVDVTFGDYLRALITADYDLVPEDTRKYRIAVIDGFRRWGIVPTGLKSLAEDSCRWRSPDVDLSPGIISRVFEGRRDDGLPVGGKKLAEAWTLSNDREEIWEISRNLRGHIKGYVMRYIPTDFAESELNLVLSKTGLRSIYTDSQGRPRLEVHSARVARRTSPQGELSTELVIELTQRRRAFLEPSEQEGVDRGTMRIPSERPRGDFTYRAGCTLVIDPAAESIRYAIRTRGNIEAGAALERQRKYINGADPTLGATYLGRDAARVRTGEPFAALHSPARI